MFYLGGHVHEDDAKKKSMNTVVSGYNVAFCSGRQAIPVNFQCIVAITSIIWSPDGRKLVTGSMG